MNKQPFYHQTEIENADGREDEIRRIVIRHGTAVLKDTIEVVNGELLFTSTSGASWAVEKALEEAGFKLSCPLESEPGDPADLM